MTDNKSEDIITITPKQLEIVSGVFSGLQKANESVATEQGRLKDTFELLDTFYGTNLANNVDQLDQQGRIIRGKVPENPIAEE